MSSVSADMLPLLCAASCGKLSEGIDQISFHHRLNSSVLIALLSRVTLEKWNQQREEGGGAKPVLIEHSCTSLNINCKLISSLPFHEYILHISF